MHLSLCTGTNGSKKMFRLSKCTYRQYLQNKKNTIGFERVSDLLWSKQVQEYRNWAELHKSLMYLESCTRTSRYKITFMISTSSYCWCAHNSKDPKAIEVLVAELWSKDSQMCEFYKHSNVNTWLWLTFRCFWNLFEYRIMSAAPNFMKPFSAYAYWIGLHINTLNMFFQSLVLMLFTNSVEMYHLSSFTLKIVILAWKVLYSSWI